jgi:positive regulator of sigma E activity
MAGAMLVSSIVATWMFELMGSVATQLACGLLILGVGITGHLLCRRYERRERRGSADPVPTPGD